MLVVTRYKDQCVVIGDNAKVTVTVLGVNKNDQVRLGFSAPKAIPIDRQEIYIRKKSENIQLNCKSIEMQVAC